tara:strand:+ start:3424 stop:4296 length:873 start_codon:yes stop_codon:yes gene_type:complete
MYLNIKKIKKKNNKLKIGLKRDIIDKFYTHPKIAQLCIDKFKNIIKLNKNDIIIEPSAGDGSFIEVIKQLSKNYRFYDIKPENNQIIKQDFLKLDSSKIFSKFNKIHVIGNPPFGRQSSLVFKFIKKASLFADSISFILPKSFKKDSMKTKMPLNFHLIYQKDLPLNSFLINNIPHDVPCVFQIWIKKNKERKPPLKLQPYGYKFVKKTEDPQLAVRRIGINAGKIFTEITNKSVTSHYFLKFNKKEHPQKFIIEASKVKFKHDNTVGPRSISKPELINIYNGIFKRLQK